MASPPPADGRLLGGRCRTGAYSEGMELPTDFFVKPVDGQDDLFAFGFGFVPEGKALEDGGTEPVVTVAENGDLIIEGYAAVFDGIDRQGENFMPEAFNRGVKAFMDGQSSLCYHHKKDMCLGKVLDLHVEEGKGLKMKARVDGEIADDPMLKRIYGQIKKGTLSALSVGGFFRRKLTENGFRISDMDFTEISVTPVPVHPGTSFAVVAGKALQDVEVPSAPESGDASEQELDKAIEELERVFQVLEDGAARRKNKTPEAAAA